VHVPHALAYPIAGQVRSFVPPDYPEGQPLIPHGLSVISTAPATFRWTFPTSPERHVRAAQLLGGDTSGLTDAQARSVLPETLLSLMRDTGIPNGLGALGFGDADVAGLVDGALKQQRLLVCCPREVGAQELEPIVRASMQHWS
jgi:alcohol dehydrogenase class IV